MDISKVIKKFKYFVQLMKKQVYTLFLASRDHRTPIFAKCLVVIVVAYALSPIDLIPDFIPIVGYLDDLLLLPIGIYLATKLIPNHLWLELQEQAEKRQLIMPKNRLAAIVIYTIWTIGFIIVCFIIWLPGSYQNI